MTTNIITIQEFVAQQIIYCVSSLIYTLTQEHKLEEELSIELWTAPVDYESAEYEIEQADCLLCQCEDYWGVRDKDNNEIVDCCHNSKEDAISDYFDGDLEEYRREIFEHWIVSSYLAKKLQEQGETVVEDFYGINFIWCRSTTGQAIYADAVIQTIYDELVNQ
ncbi:hypothetical protein [Myxosarcina sp. GI1(2024)]